MSVSAVVVSHGHAAELESSLAALAPQVDEVVVIANLPGSVGQLPPGVRVIENPRPRPLAANVNAGIAADLGRVRTVLEPRRRPGRRGRRRAPSRSWTRTRAAASQAPRSAGPTAPGSRRAGASRPSPARSSAAPPCAASPRPTRTSESTTCSTSCPTEPVEADWMLGAFLLQRRTMLEEIGGWDAGYRHYVEDIDLCYRAMRAGWERWYVPAATVTHAYAAVIDKKFLSRHTLWHLRGMARFARKHPEALVGRGR